MSETKSSDESNSNTGDNIDTTPAVVNNRFANDGSFLEMFKQMQKNMSSSQTITSIDSKTDDSLKTSDQKTVQLAEDSPQPKEKLSESEAQEGDDSKQSNTSSKKAFVSHLIEFYMDRNVFNCF